MAASESDAAIGDASWVLERIAWDGRFFLFDPATSLVYDEPAQGLLRPFGSRDAATGELLPLLRGLISKQSEVGSQDGSRRRSSVSTAERPGLSDPAFTSTAAWRCATDFDAPLPGSGFRDIFAEHGWRVHDSLQAQRDLISGALALAQQRGKAGRAAADAAPDAAALISAEPAPEPSVSSSSSESQPSPQSLVLPKARASEDAAIRAGSGGGGGFASARLDPDLVADLLTSAVPRSGDADREYVLIHLDAAGHRAPMTLHQLLRFVGDGEDAARAAAAPALTEWTRGRSPGGAFFVAVPPEPPSRLVAALEHVRAGFASLGGEKGLAAAFHRVAGSAFSLTEADGDAEPRLDGRGLLAYLRESYPDLAPADLRHLLAFLHAWGAPLTPSAFARAVGISPRRVAPRASAELDRGLRPFPECLPPKWPPDRPEWVLHELRHEDGRSFLEDRATGRIFSKNPGVGCIEGEIVAAGRRAPDGALELRRRRPGCFAQGLHQLLHGEPEIVRAVFESQWYTVTRALFWTADMLRWAFITGAREEGCGTLGREGAGTVLREVASMVEGAEPADGDHLVLQWDIFLRLRARGQRHGDGADATSAAVSGGGEPQAPPVAPPPELEWRKQEVAWPEFLEEVRRAVVHMMEAAQFPADEDDHTVNPHEHIVDSSAMDEGRWGSQLIRDIAEVELALTDALGMPHPPVAGSEAAAVGLDLSGPGGPALAMAGEGIVELLLSPAVMRVCDGEVSRLAAVLNEWDVSRQGYASLYDMRIALEAMEPRIVKAEEQPAS